MGEVRLRAAALRITRLLAPSLGALLLGALLSGEAVASSFDEQVALARTAIGKKDIKAADKALDLAESAAPAAPEVLSQRSIARYWYYRGIVAQLGKEKSSHAMDAWRQALLVDNELPWEQGVIAQEDDAWSLFEALRAEVRGRPTKKVGVPEKTGRAKIYVDGVRKLKDEEVLSGTHLGQVSCDDGSIHGLWTDFGKEVKWFKLCPGGVDTTVVVTEAAAGGEDWGDMGPAFAEDGSTGDGSSTGSTAVAAPGATRPVAEKKPSEKAPAEKKPTEKKPAEKKPAEKKPAEKKPAEKKPAEKKPAEKKPVEDKPPEMVVEKPPAEKKPAEEAVKKPEAEAKVAEKKEGTKKKDQGSKNKSKGTSKDNGGKNKGGKDNGGGLGPLATGLIVGGGGLLATSAVMNFAWVNPAWSELDSARSNPETVSSSEAEALSQSFNSRRLVTLGLGGAGVAAALGGVLVVALDTGPVHPVFGPGTIGLAGRF